MTAQATKIRRMDEGLCYGCGDRPPAAGKLQCEPCLERQRLMWKAWHERNRVIEQDEARTQDVAIAASALPKTADVEAIPDADPTPGVQLTASNRNVIRVCDAQGKPTLAILPWDAYRDLLHRSAKNRGRKARRDVEAKAKPKGGPPGRPPVVGSHILKQLIRDHHDRSDADIAAIFLEKTGVRVHRNTVYRHRLRAAERREAAAIEPSETQGGLVVNGVELGEYDAIIVEAAIRAGARPDSAKGSDEYADGLVALYEAAEDFDPRGGVSFMAHAKERIRREIARGKEDRKVKVKGKSGRVLNFSEIGDEDFDISNLIDDSGRLGGKYHAEEA